MEAKTIEQMPTQYDALNIEKEIYRFWEENNLFKADEKSSKPPYTIVIPPPNVTGVLHMGHALDGTLQDILTRYYRMSGYEALWIPGTDHAGIATQNVVEKKLREENKSRFDLGREKFLELTWKWANEHKGAILNQFKRLGASFDRSRERFTLDKGCNEAVKEVFVRLYQKGLIYKGAYIVNWCPRCCSAISDIETEYETEMGSLWEISYPLKNESGAIVVATTRPETMFGDVAIAVNPNDYKYKDLVGKKVVIPLTGREIPIIADDYVDKSFGTGAVKITPAHDPNDYEVGKRHNLKPIWVIDENGKMKTNGYVPQELQSLDRYEARKKTIEMLKVQETLLRILPHEHNVGKCQRCNTTIEPLLSEQWFVKMKPLAKQAIEAIYKNKVKFIPDRWEKNYLSWMENIRDWCISRQLWWGHQIPAYYHKETGEMIVAKENPNPEIYKQDEDVLDTWFSSGLWPFSTLNWPDIDNVDFKKFYPTTTLVTGFDIIFFWVARMITMGYEFTDKAPFSTVYIHGLIRDESGQKMSKSKGNTIDPVQIIDKYGSDALRFTLTSLNTYGGQDIKISDERFEYGRNFANKIWNASRFILINISDVDRKAIDNDKLTIADKWILNKLNETVKIFNDNIKAYRFGETAHVLYEFFWNNLCDWYLEISKVQLNDEKISMNTKRVLKYVLDSTLRLLHPIMPHITEKIWQLIPNVKNNENDALIRANFPIYIDKNSYPKESKEMEIVFETIKSLRNLRQSFNISVGVSIDIIIDAVENELNIFKSIEAYIKRLAKVNEISYDLGKLENKKCANCVVSNSKIIVPLNNLINFEDEVSRQNKKLLKLINEKKSLEARLNNEKFMKNAAPALIEQTRKRISEILSQETVINDLIKNLK